MTDRLFPSALRELRHDLNQRPIIVGVLGLGVILGISGPFDTLGVLPALPRVLYWITVVALTFTTGHLIGSLIHAALRGRPDWIKIIASTIGVGIAVTIVLLALNMILFGNGPDTWAELLELWGVVTLIAGVIEIGSYLLRTDPKETTAGPPPILARLPLEKRGALVALSAEDHYVRVTTTAGTELVLMRLSDAMTEVGSTQGLQVHRSHWVALDHVAKVSRTGDRGEVTLSDGSTRPISRGFMPAVRATGLLPKARGI